MKAQVTEPRRELVRACYPGTFHPPTVAHLAVAHAAIEQLGIDQVVFVLSRQTLGKDDSILPAPVHRAQELKSLTEIHGDRFDVAISNHSLLVDVAAVAYYDSEPFGLLSFGLGVPGLRRSVQLFESDC